MTNQPPQLEELYEALAALKRVMMKTRDQVMGDLQLTRTQIEVIMMLSELNNQTVGELAGVLGVTNSASTQTIETLVKRDMVTRVNDASDRRVVRTQLTAAGRALALQLHSQRLEHLHEVFSGLSADELAVMITVLRRLERQFDTTKVQEVTA